MFRHVVLAVVVTACSGGSKPSGTTPATPTALGLLMKEEVNPSFSRLSVLVFHAEDIDPSVLERERKAWSRRLAAATEKLPAWPTPPSETARSDEAKEVFHTYADVVDAGAKKLVTAIDRRDERAAQEQMKLIAKTCNQCHHFFRLKLEDSVVPGM